MRRADHLPGSQRRMALLVAAVAVTSLVVGLFAGRTLRSPADAAAARRPPAASPVRVPAEARVLATTVTGRGDIGFADGVPLQVSDPEAVVTEVPATAGAEVTEGSVILEVSERPILVLTGVVPMYRDLVPGSTGADVRQMEEALLRLGYRPGPVDGHLDRGSEAALARLYVDRGYSAPEPTDAGRARLGTARAALAHLEAEDLEVAVHLAATDLAAAERRAAATIGQAGAEVQAAEVARRRAEADARLAHRRLASAEAGRHPDSGEAPSQSEMTELRSAAGAADDAVEVARGTEVAATAARDATVAEQQAVVARAGAAASAARARRDDPATRDVLVEARRELAAAELAAGAIVPRDELRFVPALPARFTVVHAALGDRTSGVLAELSGQQLAVSLELPAATATGIEPGIATEVISRDPDLTVVGSVTEVGSEDQTAGTGSVRIRIALGNDAAALRGHNVQVKIALDSTRSAVLAVPLAAVGGRADGSTWVEVERAGAVHDAEVHTGLIADGYVEVRAVRAGTLRVGDLVTVGVTAGDGPPRR